jgi:hypothetical protein
MRNLTYVRQTLESELGADVIKAIHEPSVAWDLFLLVSLTGVGVANLVIGWVAPFWSVLWWLNAFVQGWSNISRILVFHDVLVHRVAFGPMMR